MNQAGDGPSEGAGCGTPKLALVREVVSLVDNLVVSSSLKPQVYLLDDLNFDVN